MKDTFIHLHVHSHYSLLDGLTKVDELVKRCTEQEMSACALTDHGILFGIIDFYEAATAKGIRPILGCEVYVAPTHYRDKSANSARDASNHLLLLCENDKGYHNLCQLVTKAHLNGWHYKPRIDNDLLEEHQEGLIAGSGCLQGRIPRLLMDGRQEEAAALLDRYIAIFGRDRFFLEMMNHGLSDEEQLNPMLWDMAQQYGVKAVATHDSHYLDPSDAEAHEVLLCIQTKKKLTDTDRMRFGNSQFYFMTAEDMRGRFGRWPEAVENSVRIAERCNVQLKLKQQLIPRFPLPPGTDNAEYLRALVKRGLEKRFGVPVPEVYLQRAHYELNVIETMAFVDYFLVVWDLVRYACEAGIPVGPGRGSGAGSLVAYALYITNLDPIRYGLLFERFLNPERLIMPDFDIDFSDNCRDAVIDYARQKYGQDCVAQISTYGRMAARSVVRNVGRALDMPLNEVNRVCNMIPTKADTKLANALEVSPELKRLITEDRHVARLWQYAQKLEGTIFNYGTHAAGVVICDHPIINHVALFKAAGADVVTTQAEMKGIEKIGLVKMDLLGLRTLTIIHGAVEQVRKNRGVDIDIDKIPLDDENTYNLLRNGDTSGMFQLESEGMRNLARRIGLETIEDITALVALYRPGPMNYVDIYIANKRCPEKIVCSPPVIRPILEETYGVCLYQEQVIQLVRVCGGFSLGKADVMRRAMSKKDAKLLEEQRAEFIEGCATNQLSRAESANLWERIETFAGYGFNKSHAAAYAYVAYQTAYLKANFPQEYMCALLTGIVGEMEKTAVYIEACRNMDVPVLPPDINHSDTGYSVRGREIRFGLSAIRNLGDGVCDAIMKERERNGPYRDIHDFCARLADQKITSRVIDSLNKAGAFLSTGWNRREVAEATDQALVSGQALSRERALGQSSLFDIGEGAEAFVPEHKRPGLPEWPEHELLKHEKEMLGVYVSGHPLRRHKELIRRYHTLDLNSIKEHAEGDEVFVCGMIGALRVILTKKNERMAFISLETLQGTCELTVFSREYGSVQHLLKEDTLVACVARINIRDDKHGLVANRLCALEQAEQELTRAAHIRLRSGQMGRDTVHRLAEILGAHIGECDVYLHCETSDLDEVVIHAAPACRVRMCDDLRQAVETLFGPDSISGSLGMGLPTHRSQRDVDEEKPRFRRRIAAE